MKVLPPQSPPLPRRARERLQHRAEILSAAEALFAQKGYHQATMEDIAQASQFAIGSLYKHFRSKEAIYVALFEERLVRYMDALERIAATESHFPAQLDEMLAFFATFSHDNGALLRLLHSSRGTTDWLSGDLKDRLEPHLERYHRSVERIMQRGIAQGDLMPLDPRDLAACAIGLMQGFFISTFRGCTEDVRIKVPLIRRMFLTGVGLPGIFP